MLRRRVLAGLVAPVVAVLVAACGLSGPRPVPPGPAPEVPAATGTGTTASIPPAGRPLLPVPDVRPAGFAAPPPGSGLSRYQRQPLVWQPCREPFQCARVLAPLDYDDPDGTAITLAVARRPATTAVRRGSLFINPGGPGGSGVDYVGYFNAAGLEAYDIVGWDPRGVGLSTPVTCFGGPEMDRMYAMDNSPDDAAELTDRIAEQQAFGRSCLERSGRLLEHISTRETVRDLDLLRALVGDERLSYLGSSYGTRIGALYAGLYPSRVGRMVLDGAVDVNSTSSVTQTDGFERALRHFATWCVQQRCALGVQADDVLYVIKRFLDGLDSRPLPGAGERALTQQLGVEAVFFSLYGRDSWGALRTALESAIADGKGEGLLRLADLSNRRRDDGSYGQIGNAFPAIRCLDSQENSVRGAQKRLAEAVRDDPVLGSLNGLDLFCPLWPVRSAPKLPTVTGEGAPPIVVVGTTGDPATPYEYAQAMAGQLSSAVLVTLEGEGHLGYPQSACVRGVAVSYLVDGVVPAEGTRCASG